MSEPLVFKSLELVTEEVKIGDATYTLHEPNGEAACAYRDALLSGTQVDKEGKVTKFGGVSAADLVMLSHCVKLNGQRISLEEVSGWPDRITGPMIKRVKEMGEYLKGENPTTDSEPSTTQDGSDSPAT